MSRLPEATPPSAASRLPAAPHARPGARTKSRVWRVLAVLGIVSGVGLLVGAIALFIVVERLSVDLPSVERLKSGYDPPQVSRIYAADGSVLSSVFTERRTVVPFSAIPDAAKLAFLAAEDARFYEHEGLNYFGVLRALWANFRAGRTVQGGSTITQQVVKNVLLDRERTLRRKVRETILARRLEQYLTKDEIFNLYLNHIYLGHGRYGIEEAARYYFGKRAAELDGAEATLLAGLVASPENFSPRRYPERALARRKYVLDQMRDKGFITEQYYAELIQAPLRLAPEGDSQVALSPEAVEVAKGVLSDAQKQHQSQGGFSVTTTIRPELQVAARRAVQSALAAYEERHKLRPPYVQTAIKSWGKPFKGNPAVNRVYVATVSSVDDQTGIIGLQVGTQAAVISLSDEERYNPKRLPPSEFTKVGAVLRVRLSEAASEDRPARARLELGPQAALVAIDVRTRDIVALVGGHDAVPGGLDRARHARRQPGSSFKPIVFSYALHTRAVTPATVLALEQPGRGTAEAPPYRISVRNALAQSNNEAAVQLLELGGPAQVVDWAHQLGIESKIGADLSLALGSYEVTPLELCNAFATFASGGFYEPPRLISALVAPGGESLPLPERAPRQRVMTAEEAFLITSLLESVVETGTGQRALKIGHPVAGKTGTTNDVKDAWFVGYSTELSVAVWVGFDDAAPLGDRESGTATALPAFVEFMTAAHQGQPRTDFPRPPGIIVAAVDPETGYLPEPGAASVDEFFLDGTVPETTAPPVPVPDPAPDTAGEMPYKPQPSDLRDLPP